MACLFCDLGKAEAVWQNDLWYVRYDRFPVSPGHVEVIPTSHVVDFSDQKPEHQKSWVGAAMEAQKIILEADLEDLYKGFVRDPLNDSSKAFCKRALQHPDLGTPPVQFFWGLNNGEAAGPTIHHLHWHIIPLYKTEMKDPDVGIRNILKRTATY